MGTKFKKGFFLFASAMLLFGAGFSFLRANDNEVVGAKAAATEVVSTFNGTSGSIDTNWDFITEKNSASSQPAFNTNDQTLRLYYGNGEGGSLLVKPSIGNSDFFIKSIEFTASSSSYTPKLLAKYGVSSADILVNSPTWSGTTYIFSNSEGFKYFFLQNANTTNTQLRLKSVKITYDFLSQKMLSSISIDSQPAKTAYFQGETFDKTGLAVTANFDDNSSTDVTDLVTISPSTLTMGTTYVVISYSFGGVEKTATINGITVETLELNSVSIKSPATKTTFSLGEEFNFDGLILTANYNSGSKELTSGFTVSGVDTNILGAQTATISLEDKSITYQVNVTNENADVGDIVNSSEIFISEYIEASSGNDKLVEIFNGTGSSIDLQNYSIKEFANGASTASYTYEFTQETILLNGETFCFVNSGAVAEYKVGKYVETSIAYFNGDDAVGLYKNDTLIDVIGVIGQDPGTAWTGTDANGNPGSTADMTLRRASSITSPNTTFSMGEWVAIANQQSDNVGTHTFASHDVTSLEQATAFADYVMTGIGSNAAGSCQTVYPLLQTEYNYMIEDSKNIFGTSTDTLFVNARARMDLIEAYVATNGSSTMEPTEDKSGNSLQNIVLIGSLGLTALVGFYILNKKKEA